MLEPRAAQHAERLVVERVREIHAGDLGPEGAGNRMDADVAHGAAWKFGPGSRPFAS